MKPSKYYSIGLLFLFIVIISLFLLESNKKETSILINNCIEINNSGTYTVENEIVGLPSCLVINSDNVVIDGKENSIIGGSSANGYAIYAKDRTNLTIKNFKITKYENGIYLENVNGATVINNYFFQDLQGIYLTNVDSTFILNNTLEQISNFGIGLINGQKNKIHNNLVRTSRTPIYIEGEYIQSDDYANNLYYSNIRPNLPITRDSSTILLNDSAKFALKLPYSPKQCTLCSYKINIYPEEKLSIAENGSLINASFTPSRLGIYSVEIILTDPKNNTENSKYDYFVGPLKSDTETYYLRGLDPTHGQPQSWGIYREDSGSLLHNKPTKIETRSCTDWVQFSPDELPDYLLGVIKEINVSIPDSLAFENSSIGIERFATYDSRTTYQQSITNKTENNRFLASFNVTWPLNYYWEWYLQSIKIVSIKNSPKIYLHPEDTPEVQATYLYPATPAIKRIDSPKVILLSATMSKDLTNGAQLILDGQDTATLSIQMPNKDLQYVAKYNGQPCEQSGKCAIEKQSEGEITILLKINGKTNLDILEK